MKEAVEKNILKNKLVWIVLGIVIAAVVISIVALATVKEQQNQRLADTEIIIEESESYTEDEIKAAIEVVKNKVKTMPVTASKIWYDEAKSNALRTPADGFMVDDTIAIFANFTADDSKKAEAQGFKPAGSYSNWYWILERKNENASWTIKSDSTDLFNLSK